MPFGQLVIGPPGSGKTTYCNGVCQYLRGLGRKVALVNLDPANDVLPYSPDVDVADLVDLEAVMDTLGLGPNGGMLYCMEYLAANSDWLAERLAPLVASNHYFIFDCPGQVELFTGQQAFKALLDQITGSSSGSSGGSSSGSSGWGFRLAAVHLVDAHLATDAAKYLSALLLSLSTMLHLELPQVNVLSKVDLLPHYGQLAFNLDYYTEVQDLSYLVASMGGGPFSQRFRKLSAGLAEVVEGYGLVAFTPLAIQDGASVARLVGQVDKANGACYARLDAPPVPHVPAELLAASGHSAADDDLVAEMQEKYIDSTKGSSSSSRRRQQQQHTAGGKDGSQQQEAPQAGGSHHQQQQQQSLQSLQQQQPLLRQQEEENEPQATGAGGHQQQQQLGSDVAAVAAAVAVVGLSSEGCACRHPDSTQGAAADVVERAVAPSPSPQQQQQQHEHRQSEQAEMGCC